MELTTPRLNVFKHTGDWNWYRTFDPHILETFNEIESKAEQTIENLYYSPPSTKSKWRPPSTLTTKASLATEKKANPFSEFPKLDFDGEAQSSISISLSNYPNPENPSDGDLSSSSISFAEYPKPESSHDSQDSPPGLQKEYFIDEPALRDFLKFYCGRIDEDWCLDFVKGLAKECNDPAPVLEKVMGTMPGLYSYVEYYVLHENRMVSVCQTVSNLLVYCEQCKEFPVFYGILRDMGKMRSHIRGHQHFRKGNQGLMAMLLRAVKASKTALLPGPLYDDEGDLSLEEGLRLAINGLEAIQQVLSRLTPLLAAAHKVLRQEKMEDSEEEA